MKTQSFSKSIITLALTFACGLVANAASPRNYLYDTKEENGLITSKTIFLQADNGMLDKQVKYEFVYNEAGQVAVKKAYRWSETKGNGFRSIRQIIHTTIKSKILNQLMACGIKRLNSLI